MKMILGSIMPQIRAALALSLTFASLPSASTAQSLPAGTALPTSSCSANYYFYDGIAARDVEAPDRFNPLRYGFSFAGTTAGADTWYSTARTPDTSVIGLVATDDPGDPFSAWVLYGIARVDYTPGSTVTIDLVDTDPFNDSAAWAIFDTSGNLLARWPTLARVSAGQHYLTMDNQGFPLEAATFEPPVGNVNDFRISDDFPTEPFTFTAPADGTVFLHNVAVDEAGGGRVGVQADLCTVPPPTPTDYSDAPTASTSYGDATHDFEASGGAGSPTTLFLGTDWTADAGPIGNADASADASDDGITLDPEYSFGGRTFIPPARIEATGTGTLHAWIDFDQDGEFEVAEYQSVAVAGGVANDRGLSWDNNLATTSGTTFVRFRFSSDPALNSGTPNGPAINGEVEDYQITISAADDNRPPLPLENCTWNWNRWEAASTPFYVSEADNAYNPTTYAGFRDSTILYTTAQTPVETLRGVSETTRPTESILANVAEVSYGIGFYVFEGGTTQSFDFVDANRFEGHAFAIVDSAGTQIARFPTTAYYASEIKGNIDPVADGATQRAPTWSETFTFTVPADGEVFLHYVMADEDIRSRYGTTNLCQEPNLETVKAASVSPLMADGTFDVTYEITVTNTGSTRLDRLSLLDDLTNASQLGSAFNGIVTAPATTGGTLAGSTLPTGNAGYDGGDSTAEMLSAGGVLAAGDSMTVAVTVNVNPTAPGAPAMLGNTATATGAVPGTTLSVTDNSENSTDAGNDGAAGPDPDGADDDTESPTVISPPVPPVANDDASPDNAFGSVVTVDIVSNDTDPNTSIDPATVSLVPPATGASNIMTDLAGDVIGFEVAGEGTWSVDAVSGLTTFTPNPNFTGDPTPIDYRIRNDDGSVSNPATITIGYIGVNSSLEILKSITGFVDLNGSTTLDAGDEVTFSFTAENTGNTSLANVSVTDAGLTPITVTPADTFDGDLAAGEGPVVIASATYILSGPDLIAGEIENSATGAGDPVATLPSGEPDPATPLLDASGDPLDTLTAVSDTSTTPDIDPTTGLPRPVATPETTETATAGGASDADPTNDPTSLFLPMPSVSVVKSIASYDDRNGNGVVDTGDRLTYSFVITNIGNTVLTNVAVTDPLPGITISGGPIASLAIGANDSTSVSATYDLIDADITAGGVENTAVADATAADEAGTPIGDPFDPGAPLTVSGTSDAGTDPDGNVLVDPALVETPDLVGTTDGDTSNDPTVFLVTPTPEISIVKSITDVADVNGNGILDVGDRVTYVFAVTNEGNVALNNITVTDPKVTVSGGPISLDIGASDTGTFTATYDIAAVDVTAGGVENTAVAEGTAVDESGDPIIDPVSGNPLMAEDDSDSGTEQLLDVDGNPVTQADADTTETPDLAGNTDTDPTNDPTVLFIPTPALTVVKSVSVVLDNNISGGDGLFGGEGDEVVYQFTVTNEGNVDIADIIVTDPLITVDGGPIDLAVNAGDSQTFTGSYFVLAEDVTRGFIENTATAEGNAIDANGDPIFGPTGIPVIVSDMSDAGTDPDAIPISDPSNTETPDGAGDTDGDSGNDPTVTRTPSNPTPRLSVIKSVASVTDTSGDGMIGEGDTVTYSFAVTNTGNVRLADVQVNDDLATVSGGPITLNVGETNDTVFTATAIISLAQATAGAVENTAEATGDAVNSLGDPIRDPDTGDQLTAVDTSDAGTDPDIGPSGAPTAYVDPLGNETPDATGGTDTDPTNDPTVLFLPAPEITLLKSVVSIDDTNGNGFTDAGDTLNYMFTVTNSGNVDLVNVEITDTLAGVTISGSPIASLPIDAVNTDVTATYRLSAADISANGVENTAEATGDGVDSDGNPLGDPANPGQPLTVTDTSDAGTDPNGDPVTNPDGTETPDLAGDTDGDTSNDPTVFTVPASPMIALTKSIANIEDRDSDNRLSVGDVVTYTFAVTNTGNVDLADIGVNDANGTVTGGPIDLAIGQTDRSSLTMTYEIVVADVAAGELVNTATATGDAVDANGDTILDPVTGSSLQAIDVSDTGTEPAIGSDGTPGVVPNPEATETGAPDGDPTNDPTVLAIPDPELTVVKSVANAFDTNGDGLFGGEDDEVVYSFRVTNTGNVNLSGVTLSDSLVPVTGGPIDLDVGAGDGLSFTATYIVTAADLALGFIENTATATGTATDDAGSPILGLDGQPITTTDISDAGTDPDAEPIDDPAGIESPDGEGDTDGDPGNDPTVLSVPANASPRLSVIKSVSGVTDNGDNAFGAGDTVNYSFVVTNTGNVDLADVTLTDPSAAVLGGPISLILGEADTTTFTATRVITEAEAVAGSIENTATATGGAVNSLGQPITEPGNGSQLIANDTSDTGTAAEFGASGVPQAITDPENNETPDANGETDTDPSNDPTVLFIPMPDLQVVKSVTVVQDTNGDGLFGGEGDVIEFGFDVFNMGNTDLANVVITDSIANVSGGPVTIPAGESDLGSFTATYVVTAADFARGFVENTATGSGDAVGSDGFALGDPLNPGVLLMVSDVSDAGTDPDGATVNNPEDAETPDGLGGTDGNSGNDPTVISIPANPTPEVSIIKSVVAVIDTNEDQVVGGAGDQLIYQFSVTNSGNVDLVDVALTDAAFGGEFGSIASLPVGAEVIVNQSYIISAADQDAGFVENTATASGVGVNATGDPLLDADTGEQLSATDVSDTGTDSSLNTVDNSERVETTSANGTADDDPTNDPTVTLVPVAVPNTAISGTFFTDQNNNGVFDDADTPLAGIIVNLRNVDGTLVASTITDANGFYELSGFPVGTLDVEFVDPETGLIVGQILGLEFTRNTVLSDQDGLLVPPVDRSNLILTKTTPLTNVLIGGSVPYTITVENRESVPFRADIVDQLPPGFLYSPDTGSVDGVPTEPTVNGQTLSWDGITVASGQTVVVELVARVGLNVATGDLVNTARALDPVTGNPIATPATATVRRSPEAVFECSDIIGKVFDDVNRNGYQDGPFIPNTAAITDQTYYGDKFGSPAAPAEISEPGIPGARLITTGGLIITADEYGRFNVPCAALPGDIGENFTLKVDTNSLPTGYRMTTENPRTMRVTAGILTEMNFGASIGRVVDIDLTGSAFTSDHKPVAALAEGLNGLLNQVKGTPSILRISYFTNGESKGVAQARLNAFEQMVRDKWSTIGNYRLVIERTVTRLQ